MTLRRLGVLIRALPAEASLWAEMRRTEEQAKTPTVDRLRAAQAYWNEQKRLREETA